MMPTLNEIVQPAMSNPSVGILATGSLTISQSWFLSSEETTLPRFDINQNQLPSDDIDVEYDILVVISDIKNELRRTDSGRDTS